MKRSNELETTAYHEAGHAVLAWKIALGKPKIVSIEADDSSGLTSIEYYVEADSDSLSSSEFRKQVEGRCIGLLAGVEAEVKFTGELVHPDNNKSDRDSILRKLELICSSTNEIQNCINFLEESTANLVDEYWPIVTALAEALLERKTIEGKELIEIMEAHDS
jgi:ATP-dependent Zn protease